MPYGAGAVSRNPAQVSFFLLEQAADAAMTYFYGQLFLMDTEIRAMFPAAMDRQRRHFFRALVRIAEGPNGPDEAAALVPYLEQLGRAHRKYGVREGHYDLFRRALMATLQRFAASSWDEAAQQAWESMFDQAARIMIDAAKRDAEESPAWWIATVTGTEPRGPDVAVLTLAPEQPLTYQPGQYVSVQTPHWPRLWRRYSIANAPRPDGLLRLHVRAVPGGRVSTALVHQTRAGDTVVLGRARGEMTANAVRSARVVCIAGGTGLAPVKAIAEALTSPVRPHPRPVVRLFFGARTRADLYDLPDLRRLAGARRSLTVIPVVADRQSLAVPAARTIVVASTASTAQARKTAMNRAPAPMLSSSGDSLRSPAV